MNNSLALAEELRLLQGQHPEQILPAAQALLQAAQQEGDPRFLLQASDAIALCLMQLRDYDQARQWFQRALDICRMHRDKGAEAGIRENLGLIHLLQGHYELALEQFMAGRACLGQARRDTRQLGLLHNSAVALHRLERFEEAVEANRELLQLGLELGMGAREEVRCLLNLARSLERCDRLEEAERACHDAFRGLHEAGAAGLVAYCQAMQARVAHRRGSHAMAMLLAREAHLSLDEQAPDEERLEVLMILGRCEAQGPESERAEAVYREAVEITERRHLHHAAMECCQELAACLSARQHWEEALSWQERALLHHKQHHQAELERQRVQNRQRLQERQGGWRELLAEPVDRPADEPCGEETDDSPLPICSCCKKIRGEASRWEPLENYLLESHGLLLSHGLCPDCATEMYQDLLEGSRPENPGD